jgi:CheY-like chemotaxis protein
MLASSIRPRLALVIDQDVSQPPTALAALAAAGFETQWAVDRRSAHLFVRQRLFDLIVCDLYLGDESGIELVRELRELPAMEETPTMFLSSKQSIDVIRRSCGATGTYFLRKPVDDVVLSSLAIVATKPDTTSTIRAVRTHSPVAAPHALSRPVLSAGESFVLR